MNDEEPQLRRHLQRAAAAVPTEPRWDDLTRRIDRAGRRRLRMLTAVVVVALVAGPLAGFAAGRLTAPSTGAASQLVLGAPTTVDAGPPTTVPTHGGPLTANVANQGLSQGPAPSESLDRLFNRTTAQQIALRVFGVGTAGPCSPINVIVEASSPSWINQSTASVFLSDPAVLDVVGYTTAGEAEGGLSTIVVVHVNTGVATVRLQIHGGGTDAMAPDNGLAVLAAPNGDSIGVVQVLSSSGHILATAPVNQTPVSHTTSVSCAPPTTTPPTLPQPGPQPSDPVAAKTGVLNAFTRAYELYSPAVPSYVEGWTAAMSAASSKVVKQWGIKSATVRVNTIVFTSPTTAAVEYDLLVPPFGPFNGRIGNAVFDQGVWKVTAATVCRDISLGGASC